MTYVRAIRGATTCAEDSPGEIGGAVQELLSALLERNGLTTEDVVSVILTSTPDLVSAFPATAARSIGFGDVPLLCASEIAVPGSKPRCLRVMMHVNTPVSRAEIRHVYLREAVTLRDDIAQ